MIVANLCAACGQKFEFDAENYVAGTSVLCTCGHEQTLALPPASPPAPNNPTTRAATSKPQASRPPAPPTKIEDALENIGMIYFIASVIMGVCALGAALIIATTPDASRWWIAVAVSGAAIIGQGYVLKIAFAGFGEVIRLLRRSATSLGRLPAVAKERLN